MSKQEIMKLMRLLSALEGVMLTKAPVPDYLLNQIDEMVVVLERELLK